MTTTRTQRPPTAAAGRRAGGSTAVFLLGWGRLKMTPEARRASAMAEGIRTKASTHVGIGVTGIAGQGGSTPDKPIGTVMIAVLIGADAHVRTFQFIGSREMVKFQSTQAALNMLRLMLK